MRQTVLKGILLGTVMISATLAQAQPTPENLCIQQVGEQYQSLLKEPESTGLLGATDIPWGQQLTAVAAQVRQNMTLAQIKGNQATLAEKNVAQLLEQLRQANEAGAALRKTVAEQAKALEQATGGATGTPAPRN
jgi:hypothetical protein